MVASSRRARALPFSLVLVVLVVGLLPVGFALNPLTLVLVLVLSIVPVR